MMEIKNICILSAGNLGSRIALQSAVSGFVVSVYDIKLNSPDFAQATIVSLPQHLFRAGEVSGERGAELVARINITADAQEAVEEADLISENVTEDLTVKRKVWRH